MGGAARASEAGGRARPWLARALAALDEAGRRVAGGGEELVLAQVPAPVLPLDEALARLQAALAPWRAAPAGEDRALTFWDPPAGTAVVGLGVAARLRVDGAGGAMGLRRQAEALWARVATLDLALDGEEGPAGPGARLFGGLAFQAGGAGDGARAAGPAWHHHGDGAFTLPRLRYARDGERAWLAVALGGSSGTGAGVPGEEQAQARAAIEALAEPAGPGAVEDAAPRILREHQQEPARWAELVEAALAEIAAGRARKIVAARPAEVVAEAPFDAARVVARLAASAAGCARFAFEVDGATFLGATPERLAAKQGGRVTTEALAGTIAAGAGAADRLLASAKDREEHDLVVREIERRLGPLCHPLALPAGPAVRALRGLLHLWTPIAGELRRPAHLLELAAALHPTPAVGGLPSEAALAFIAAREAAPRGWYAGPVGWFDAAGDGELMVALRSGLIEGAHAWLFAGAGIVAGSEAAREYEETALKQRPMRAALGLEETAEGTR